MTRVRPREPAANETVAEGVLRRLQPAPFWDLVGAELTEAVAGRAVVRIAARREFGRSGGMGDGTLHGGIVASAIDMAASCALITVLSEDEGRTTVDLTINYLAPARGDLTATGTLRRRGGRVAVIDIEVEAAGETVALGRATFAILRPAK
ncbi:MAG: PaaI family thioesterase [Chloroflexi bacterium]|nr:PaaI family thioesterase [Chloroflexota bacterium]